MIFYNCFFISWLVAQGTQLRTPLGREIMGKSNMKLWLEPSARNIRFWTRTRTFFICQACYVGLWDVLKIPVKPHISVFRKDLSEEYRGAPFLGSRVILHSIKNLMNASFFFIHRRKNELQLQFLGLYLVVVGLLTWKLWKPYCKNVFPILITCYKQLIIISMNKCIVSMHDIFSMDHNSVVVDADEFLVSFYQSKKATDLLRVEVAWKKHFSRAMRAQIFSVVDFNKHFIP